MSDFNSRRSDSDLKRLIRGELSPNEAETVWRRLQDDPEARGRFERWVAAERALEGSGEQGLGIGGRARVQARLFAPEPSRWRVFATQLRWSTMALAAATAAWVAFALLPPQQRPSSDGFEARSGASSTPISPDRVLQVLRISVTDDGGFSVEPAERLQPKDELRFAAFVRSGTYRISVLAVDATGKRQVLVDRARMTARPLAQRLAGGISVPNNWKGPVRFIGVFEDSGKVDLSTLALDARDEAGLSVRVVHAVVGGPDR